MRKSAWVTYPKRLNCCSFFKHYNLQKPVKSLSINITAMGWYHLFIDGVRIDQDVFSPGWTNYYDRVQYQRYELTPKQSFDLNVDLAEGWGGGDRFAWASKGRFLYFQMALNYELKVIYKDGSKESFYSDSSLKVFENKYIDSTIYYGEQVDFRRKHIEIGRARKIKIDTKIIPNEGPHIVYGENFPAKRIFKDPKGNVLVDFGQNLTGVIRIKVKGKRGDVVSYTPAEVLDKDGVFYNENYRKCTSTIYSFVLSGEEETLVPSFSFLGGRYIKLIDCPSYITKENFTAVLVHSEMESTCAFETGNEKINRLYLNTRYGQLSNYLDVPTDCPQRDERLGWTGDAMVFCKTGAIHFDVHSFFRKWIHDLMFSQFKDGAINGVVPLIFDIRIISSGWGDVSTVVPFEIYKAYGDKKLLVESIPMMEKWIAFVGNNHKENNPYIIDLKTSFGDWLALDKAEDNETHDYKGLTDISLIDTAFYAYSVSLLASCLDYLNKDSAKYWNLFNKIKKAYQKEFIVNHHLKGEKALLQEDYHKPRTCYTQTGLSLTLHFGLCDEEDSAYLSSDLDQLVKEVGNRLTTGFLGTPYLLYALSENGHVDTAYEVLFQEKFPSWLYSVNKGATTMWEHYDGIKEDGSIVSPHMNSFNHYAYGSVFAFMFEYFAGIKNKKPSYREVEISPVIDKRLGFVRCSFKTKYGLIKSEWEIIGDKVNYRIDVPQGIKAKIVLKNSPKITLHNGGSIQKILPLK